MSWITEHPGLAWLALALALGAFEVASLDFVFLMFAGGALAGSLAGAFGAPFVVQVVVAVGASLVLLGVARPVVVRHLHAGEPTLTGAAALVGRTARVVDTVTATDGRVKIAGEIWSARSSSAAGTDVSVALQPGQSVRVLAIEGATAVVAPTDPYHKTQELS